MRSGNFSSTAADNAALCANNLFSICNLAPGIGGNNNFNGFLLNGNAVSGGIIPTSTMDPGGLALMKLYPLPNTNPASNTGGFNFVLPVNTQQNGWMFHTRVDYDYSANTKGTSAYNRSSFATQPRGSPTINVNDNKQFGFADIRYGQRIVELAAKYSF